MISLEAIYLAYKEVNQVRNKTARPKKKGSYIDYTPELQAEIGRYASCHSTSEAARYFTRKLEETVSKTTCTIQSIKKTYKQELKQKRMPLRELTT